MSYSTSLFSQNATLEQLSIDTELGLLIMVQKTSITFFLDTLGGVHFLRHHLAAGQHKAPWRQRIPTNLPPQTTARCIWTMTTTTTSFRLIWERSAHTVARSNSTHPVFQRTDHLCHGSCSTPVLSNCLDLHRGSLYPMMRLMPPYLTSYDSPSTTVPSCG